MKKRALSFITALTILVLSISGCGKKAEQTENEAVDTTIETPVEEVKKSLTISLCWDFYYVEEAVENFKKNNPDFEVSLTKYSNDTEKYISQVSTALMAGNADDILDGYGINYRDDATVKLLTDFYPLMQADPAYNEDKYFTNVFKALEYEGGLYTFPSNFSFDMVLINNRISDELTSEFSKLSRLNTFDLIDFYNRAKAENGADYYIHDGFDVLTAFFTVTSSFIDMENKTCDFNNPRFINFLNDAKNATEPGKAFGYTYSSNSYPPEEEAAKSKKYMFQTVSADVYQYLLDFEEDLVFSNPVPFTDEKGDLRISPLKNFCISAQSKNKEIAWEFIKFMASEDVFQSENAFIPSLPVYKELLAYKFNTDIPIWTAGYFVDECGWHIKGDVEAQTEKAITKISGFSNMPMFYTASDLYTIIMDPIEQFNNGNLTAEQLASELQNKVSLALME